MVAFNLGYLPGGDRDIRTTAETTLAAFSAAAAATMVNGVVFLTCYVGHEGGSREYEVLMTHLRALDPREWNVVVHEVRVAPAGASLALRAAQPSSHSVPHRLFVFPPHSSAWTLM